MTELEFHQAQLLASSIRREIRKTKDDIERGRESRREYHLARLGSMIETLQFHLDKCNSA